MARSPGSKATSLAIATPGDGRLDHRRPRHPRRPTRPQPGRAGQAGQVLGRAPASAYAASRASRSAGPGSPTSSATPSTRSASPTSAASAVSSAPAAGEVVDDHAQPVAGFVAGRHALLVVGRPDGEVGAGHARGVGEPPGDRARGGDRVGHPRERTRHVGGSMGGGEADDGDVGDDAGRALAGHGDGAGHGASRRRGQARGPAQKPGQTAAQGREDLARRLGPVQRVEVQAGCAAVEQGVAELGRDLRCPRPAAPAGSSCSGRIRASTSSGISAPGQLDHPAHRGEVQDRHDARDDREVDAGGAGALDEAEVVGGAQHHLGDGELGAGVVLGLQHLRVLVEGRGVAVALGEGGDADGEVARRPSGRPPGRRRSRRRPAVGTHAVPGPPGRVAAQRQHVVHARVAVRAPRTSVISARVWPTQVRCAIGSIEVSCAIRRVIATVRSRVVPPAP